MKYITFLILLAFSISTCSDSPSTPKKDTVYNIEKVRIIIPTSYQKVPSTADLATKISSENNLIKNANELLLRRMTALNQEDNHFFFKEDDELLSFLSLQTNGPPVIMNKENTDYFLRQFENSLEDNFASDETYSFRRLEEKLSGANRVKYFKFKYYHKEKDLEWYSTNYLIYANSRTIKLSIISPNQNHNDLENYMQFIQIK